MIEKLGKLQLLTDALTTIKFYINVIGSHIHVNQ